MVADLKKAVAPLRKLRKALKQISADPSPEEVHHLRAQTRRFEATAHALSPTDDEKARRLLKLLKPVRKAAGDVRDMDVLIGKLFALTDDAPGDSLVQLEEHLAARRIKCAKRLHRVVARRGKKARRLLKRYACELKDSAAGNRTESFTAPQILAIQLQNWPPLRAENLHEFRIHAKELRYMLQLSKGGDGLGMSAFVEVKDAAGDWHDWLELRKAAEGMKNADEELLRHIERVEKQKLRAALTAANRVRESGLAPSKNL